MAAKNKDKNRRRDGKCIDKIRALMADGAARTTLECTDAVGIPYKTGVLYFRHASQPGEFQEVHSIDNRGLNGAKRYVWGKGKNKALTRGKRLKPESEMTDGELDEKYKCERQWPAPDLLVIQSFNAMVRLGAPA